MPLWHNRQVNLTAREPVRQPCTAFLDEEHIDAGILSPVLHEKIGEQVFNDLRRRSNSEHACDLSRLKG